jgi:D-alanyl-D-alanine carboxypeptidase
MHELGLAIDFTYQGRVIASRDSPAFGWLAANAAAYGFYNLPAEPWHWSVNGQ